MSMIVKTMEELNEAILRCHKVTAECGMPVPRVTECEYVGPHIYHQESASGFVETYLVHTEPNDGEHQRRRIAEMFGVMFGMPGGLPDKYNNIAVWREDDIQKGPHVILFYEPI